MRSRRSLLAAFLLASASVSASARQAARPMPPPAGSANPKLESRERQNREAALRSAEATTTARRDNQRQIEAAVEQLKQDFKRIQILRNELVRHISHDEQLDYELISDKAGEINKRANRLKSHLVQYKPGPEEKEPKAEAEVGEDQMKGSLVTLCQRIESFVESPVFKMAGVVDVEQAAKAGRDLRDIIQLSGDIKKGAERLHKTSSR